MKAAVDALGLEYKAEFVPFSKSRNAKAKPTKPGDYSLNWRVTISKGGRSLTTDYMQGVGHIPGHKQNTRYTIAEWEALKYACEHGKTTCLRYGVMPSFPSMGAKPIPAPELHDVLYSLSMDASALDYPGFEDWASEYGYEADSRSAEKIYRECLRLALELRTLIGEQGLATLRDAAQDY